MSEIKLKPCPFCGGTGQFRTHYHGLFQIMKVECMVCEAVSPRGLISQDDFRDDAARDDAQSTAAWRWNRRAGDENE